ncbi:MAG TPA: response regulator [Armatimonadota bacterium]|nr:response regulator [Armatimonadota bacterium]
MQKRVLVVDDHPPTLRLITNALKKQGLEVATARNGAECLLSIESRHPDLLVLDVIMPVIDGFQTLRILRENEATKALPVIILSIRSEDEDILKGMSGGADIYITKPFNMADLVTAVMRILQVTDGH